MIKADIKLLRQLESVEDLEKVIEKFEVPIFDWLTIKPKKCFSDKIARIDVANNEKWIAYDRNRLNEILYAVSRTSIEEIIKEHKESWEKFKKYTL